ncbi:MAG: hypothetical protein ACK4JE_02435, partial [Endomicrobiia bacterium]
FVINIMKEKDHKSMIKILSPLAKKVIIFKSKNPRSALPEDLYLEWLNFIDGSKIKIMDDLSKIISEIKKEKFVCFTGSLYFAGEVLEFLNEKKYF